jgi:hypothetical protein
VELPAQFHDPVRLRVRQRLEKNRVDHGENGRVRPDANRERGKCDSGEAQIAAHGPQRISNVGGEGVHQKR